MSPAGAHAESTSNSRSAKRISTITATVRSTDRTGVEMEALTAVSVAALTLYDMIKAVDPAARIDDIRVLRKDGGRRRNVGAMMAPDPRG